MAYKLEHMGLGGILDQAIAICKDHFGLLFKIMLFMYVPLLLAIGLFGLVFEQQAAVNADFDEFRRQGAMQDDEFVVMIPFLLSTLVVGLVIYPVTNAAIIHAVAKAYLGEAVTALDALKHGIKRFWALFWTAILVGFATNLGFLLCIVPGVIFWIWFGLSQQVVVLESVSGSKAMDRSRKLVKPDWVTFFVLSLILSAISFGINMSAEFIPQPYVALAVSSVSQAVSTLLWAAAFVVFYFSARCREENFDLHYLAQAIAEEPPVESGPTL